MALVEAARVQLARTSDSDDNAEFLLQVLLQAIVTRRQPDALELTLDALVSDNTLDKEAYVQIANLLPVADIENVMMARLDASIDPRKTRPETRSAVLVAIAKTLHGQTDENE